MNTIYILLTILTFNGQVVDRLELDYNNHESCSAAAMDIRDSYQYKLSEPVSVTSLCVPYPDGG